METNIKKKENSLLLLIVLSFGFVMAVLDTTGVVLAVPEIKKILVISLNDSIWIINSYILALGTFLLLSGSLSAKYGAKKIMMAGMALFVISSFGCSIAADIKILIFCRFFQGLGAASFMPSSMSLLFMAYPDAEKRSKMLGIWTSIISVATGTGSFIGGTIIQYWGWRSIFLINIPMGVITILFIAINVKDDIKNSGIKIDILSHLLLVLTISSIIVFLVEGNQFGYTQGRIIAFLFAFLCFGVIFVVREKRISNPIIPTVLLRKAKFTISNILGLIINISLYGIVLVLGLYFQIHLHLSPMISGLLILPGMVVLIIGNLFYAKYTTRLRPYRLLIGSVFVTLIGAGAMYLFSLILNPLPNAIIVVIFSIMNLGIGVLVPALTTVLMEASGREYSSMAGATLNANKQIGGLFGTAIMGMVISSYGDSWSKIIQITFLINIVLYLVGFILSKKFMSEGD